MKLIDYPKTQSQFTLHPLSGETLTMNAVQVALFLALLGLAQLTFTLADDENPPPANETAKMARYILRNSDWVSIATLSTQKAIEGFPYVSLDSISEGTKEKSTGIPYLYLTDRESSAMDLSKDNRCTIMATLAQSDYCKSETLDPQHPRCPKLMITGHLVKVDNTTAEHQFAQEALYERHPSMKFWPKSHGFQIAKVDITQVQVLAAMGGMKTVTVPDYLN